MEASVFKKKLSSNGGKKTEALALKNESLKQNESNLVIGTTIAKYIDP